MGIRGLEQRLIGLARAVGAAAPNVAGAGRCLVDGVACAYLGLHAPVVAAMRDAVSVPDGGSTLWGSDRRARAADAALVHATAAHVFDIGDGFADAGLHPGEVVVPVVLAVAERCGSTGEEMIGALIGAYEIIGRLGRGLHPELTERGICPTGPVGAIGAAFAAGCLIGLDDPALVAALGTAALIAPLATFEWDDSRPLHAGMAAQAGIRAADLADRGVGGGENWLTGPSGLAAIAGVDGRVLVDRCLADLAPAVTRVYFKPYAACRHSHGAIRLAASLRASVLGDDGRPPEVAALRVTTYPLAVRLVDRRTTPGDPWAACDTSVQFAVAKAWLHGDCGPEAMGRHGRADREAHRLGERVEVAADGRYGARYPDERWTRLEVWLADGRHLEAAAPFRPGDPEDPITTDALVARLVTWSAAAIGVTVAQAEDVAARLLALPAGDPSVLFAALGAAGRTGAPQPDGIAAIARAVSCSPGTMPLASEGST